jgi:hypothetical protein
VPAGEADAAADPPAEEDVELAAVDAELAALEAAETQRVRPLAWRYLSPCTILPLCSRTLSAAQQGSR